MMRWNETEYAALFGIYPPDQTKPPSLNECRSLAGTKRHSPEAVLAQWNDARSFILGQVSAASSGLQSWLTQQGYTR